MELTTLFCQIDDFCADFEAEYYKHLIDDGKIKRVRKSRLSLSEVMTIIIQFQRSGYRTFKHYYQRPVSVYLRWAFPQLVSYHRFVELMAEALVPYMCLSLEPKRPMLGHFFYRLHADCRLP